MSLAIVFGKVVVCVSLASEVVVKTTGVGGHVVIVAWDACVTHRKFGLGRKAMVDWMEKIVIEKKSK